MHLCNIYYFVEQNYSWYISSSWGYTKQKFWQSDAVNNNISQPYLALHGVTNISQFTLHILSNHFVQSSNLSVKYVTQHNLLFHEVPAEHRFNRFQWEWMLCAYPPPRSFQQVALQHTNEGHHIQTSACCPIRQRYGSNDAKACFSSLSILKWKKPSMNEGETDPRNLIGGPNNFSESTGWLGTTFIAPNTLGVLTENLLHVLQLNKINVYRMFCCVLLGGHHF